MNNSEENIKISGLDWFIESRNIGEVVNIPMALFNQLLNPKLTSYCLTYLKLRYLSQPTYGSFKSSDFNKISKVIGLSKPSLKSHISKLIELGWLREKHQGFFQLVSFHKTAYSTVFKLTTEQIFAVRNSTNTDRTRLTFEKRIGNEYEIKIEKINSKFSLSLQEFRVILTELVLEIDTNKKIKYTKFFDSRSKNMTSEGLTSPTKWQRDCTKGTRHIAVRYTSKKLNLSIGSILTYRKKSALLNFSSYQKRIFKVKDSKIINHAINLGSHKLNDSMKTININKAKNVGYFFVNRNGELTKNQISYRRINTDLIDLKFLGVVRGTKGISKSDKTKRSIRKIETKKLSKNLKLNFQSIPFFEENKNLSSNIIEKNKKSQKMKTSQQSLSKIKKTKEPKKIFKNGFEVYIPLSLEEKREKILKTHQSIPYSDLTRLEKYDLNENLFLPMTTFEEKYSIVYHPEIDWNTFNVSFSRFEELKTLNLNRTQEEDKELILLSADLTKLDLNKNPRKGKQDILSSYFFSCRKVSTELQNYYYSKISN